MSVSVNLVGMTPGGGGSFPMAGTRHKVRKVITYAPGTYTWVAPQNVFFISLAMCGGGAGAGGNGYYLPSPSTQLVTINTGDQIFYYQLLFQSHGGAAGTCIPPTVIPVTPGQTYTIVAGAGGTGGTTTRSTAIQANVTSGSATGSSGGASSFRGDMITVYASGGLATSGSFLGLPGTLVQNTQTFGFQQIAGQTGSSGNLVFGNGSSNGPAFTVTYAGIGTPGDAGDPAYYSITAVTTPVISSNTQVGRSGSVEFSTHGASRVLSGSLISAVSASASFGGAPSLFSDGAASAAVSGGKPPTPGYGAGGAANAYCSLVRTSATTYVETTTVGALFTSSIGGANNYGYGGDGGPGMVRIIWEE